MDKVSKIGVLLLEMDAGDVEENILKTIAFERLRKESGYEPWMYHWVHIEFLSNGNLNKLPVYCCSHPDYEVFYASTSAKDAVEAFSKYPYMG